MGRVTIKSEGQILSEVRAQGKDTFFQWYLLQQRLRIVGAILASTIAKPLVVGLNRMSGGTRG